VLTRSSELEQQAHDEAELEAERLRRLLEGTGVEVMGPSPAFIPRLRSLYRWQLTIRAPRLEAVRPYLPSGRGWAIDVDPA
jgi:primosomal protein N' (replication factor Y)